MLARLVVHLQANYGSLTSGLQVARNQTAVAAQSISQSVAGIADGSQGFGALSAQADEVASAMEAISTTATIAEQTITTAAFTADVAAGAFSRLATTAATVSAGVGVLDRASLTATGSLSTVTAVAGSTVPVLHTLSGTAATAGTVLRTTALGARSVASGFAVAAGATRTAATGISHVAHVVHAAFIVVELLRSGLAVLLIPLRLIGAIGAAAFSVLGVALRTVLLPVRLLWSGLTLVAQAVWSVVKPLTAVALSIMKVWFLFKGWIGSIRVIIGWLGMLPPKMRLLVGSLLALGLAGKAGALALRVLSVAISTIAVVARGAIAGFKLLLLPIMLITHPARAAAMAMSLLSSALLFAGRVAARAGLAFLGLTAHIARLATQGIAGAISSFAALGASMLRIGTQSAVIAAIAASVWGVKLATAAETSRVVFGTMLHDMAQGKALLEQMQSSKVAPFFDAKAIQDAGRDLLKAKVPVDQITNRMEQLGGIAMATKTPVEDLSRIYRQGMAKGAFQTDLVNQMAERGIDIYAALTAVTGKSGQALAEMMTKGEIGAAQMNAAIDHMTLGHGIYAGVVDNVGKTTAGMWAKSTNNISMALQTMFSGAVDGSKGLLASFVDLTEQIKQRATTIAPVILQMANTIGAIFLGLRDVVTTVWTSIFGTTQATYAGMLGSTMDWVTKFRWFFTNIVPIVQFVGLMMLAAMLSTFNDIAYWFTTKLPAYLDWFANNWRAVFRDIAVGTMTVFSNLGTNIKGAMGEIWKFIRSGGMEGLEFTWTPLLDGFKQTMAELPNIPERPMTAMELGMQEQIQAIGTDLADSFDAMGAEASAAMVAAAVVPPIVPLQNTPAGGGDQITDETGKPSATEKAKQAENKAVLVRSEEGQKALASLLRSGMKDDKKTAEKIAVESRDHLARIARNSETTPKLRSRQFAPG